MDMYFARKDPKTLNSTRAYVVSGHDFYQLPEGESMRIGRLATESESGTYKYMNDSSMAGICYR